LLQNENGPCPLLAAANVLLLREAITLPSNCKAAGVVTIEELTNVLAEKILTNHSNESDSNADHHIHETLKIFPNLQFGMDVNPKFTAGPTGVEYTLELNAFDLLHVELVHGWLLDPEAQEYEWVGNNTYNQLVNLVIQGNDARATLEQNPPPQAADGDDNHPDELSNQATRGSVIHHFLERSAHQLTQYGLQTLHEYVKEGDMVVFFRNNHYNTLTKHEGHLFLLVTDFGYADVSSVVWEKLDVIDGDTEYVDGNFKVPPPIAFISGAATGEQMVANNLQANSDYQLALQLSRETESSAASAATGNSSSAPGSKSPSNQSKHDRELELAKQASLLEHQQYQEQIPSQTTGTIAKPPPAAASTPIEGSLKPPPAQDAVTQPSLKSPPPAAPAATTASIPPQQPSAPTIPKDLPPGCAIGVPISPPNMSQEERDHLLALQLHQQEEKERQAAMEAARAVDPSSERLAEEMQKREYMRQQQRMAAGNIRQQQVSQRAVPVPSHRAKAGGSKSDGCIIS
jgi:hypothetical protein